MSREQRVLTPHARQSLHPASLPERKAVALGTMGGNAAPGFRLGILATQCFLSCAFLHHGSWAFEVLSTVRFCGVPAGLVEVPQGSDLAAHRLRWRGELYCGAK